MKDIASRDLASPRRAARPGRALVACAVIALTSLLASGCSTLRSVGDTLTFWSHGDGNDALRPGDAASLLDDARAMMAAEPSEPYWPYRVAEIYTDMDSTAQAVAHLESALAIDGRYAPAAALLSKHHYNAGRYESGIQLLTAVLENNPEAPDALRAALALHLEAVGDLDGAHAALEQCAGNSAEVRAARTFVTLRDDDPGAAMELAKQALEDNPGSAAAHNNLGIALLWSGRPSEARDQFSRALELNDKLPGALYNMAIVEAFYFLNEDAGRKWFSRYKQLATDDPDDLAAVLGTDVSTRLKREPVN